MTVSGWTSKARAARIGTGRDSIVPAAGVNASVAAAGSGKHRHANGRVISHNLNYDLRTGSRVPEAIATQRPRRRRTLRPFGSRLFVRLSTGRRIFPGVPCDAGRSGCEGRQKPEPVPGRRHLSVGVVRDRPVDADIRQNRPLRRIHAHPPSRHPPKRRCDAPRKAHHAPAGQEIAMSSNVAGHGYIAFPPGSHRLPGAPAAASSAPLQSGAASLPSDRIPMAAKTTIHD